MRPGGDPLAHPRLHIIGFTGLLSIPSSRTSEEGGASLRAPGAARRAARYRQETVQHVAILAREIAEMIDVQLNLLPDTVSRPGRGGTCCNQKGGRIATCQRANRLREKPFSNRVGGEIEPAR